MKDAERKYTLDFILKAHKKSSNHRNELFAGELCGCFNCKQTFPPQEIFQWLDGPDDSFTAICPQCGIDSVLSSELPITDPEFLKEMKDYWF